MKSYRFFKPIVLSLLMAVLISAVPSLGSTAIADDAVVRSFLKHLDDVDSDRGEQAKRAVNDHADSAVDALTEGLIALYPDYANAVEASDDDRLEDAVRQLTPLTQSDDAYLAADAMFFLARTYMNHERYEDAIGHLENLTSSAGDVSVHQGPAQYFLGLAQSQAEKLNKIEDGALPDVHLRMDYSRRRLEQQKTDPDTQQQQDKIVKMLSELIKKAEKEEASSSNSNTKKPQDDKKPKPQDGKKPSAPKPKPSPGQNNQGSSQPNGRAELKNYDDSPASPWSRLRDRSRDPANNAVKEKLPARYRDIVERYMEAANGETEK